MIGVSFVNPMRMYSNVEEAYKTELSNSELSAFAGTCRYRDIDDPMVTQGILKIDAGKHQFVDHRWLHSKRETKQLKDFRKDAGCSVAIS